MNASRDAWTTYAQRQGLLTVDLVAPSESVNKYHAKAVHIDGVRFASKKEAARFLELRLMEKHGLIADLETQPAFPLHIMEIWRSGLPIRITTAGRYTADFRYTNLETGEIVVEDTKSPATRTTDYKLRKTIAQLVHGMTVEEV